MTRPLVLRLFGFTALCAVGSFWHQLPGLHGSDGLAPAVEHLEALRKVGASAADVPTLLWLWPSDTTLHVLCAAGVASALLLIAAVAPRLALATLWLSWGSLVSVCSPFLNFQWDILLVESAFCLWFYAPPGRRPDWSKGPHPAARFTMAWLACKVTLGSGLVKLMSGDPSWRDLTALTYHWWTQPLPVWTSAWVNDWPVPVQQAMCAVMFVFELPLPLLALGPPRLQRWAGLGLVVLQAGLFATGNFSYYNVLAAVLALPLLVTSTPSEPPAPRWPWAGAVVAVALGVAAFFHQLPSSLARWHTFNAYGAFAHMTKTRSEIVVEGSADGVTWKPYRFQYKPGPLDERPQWVAPFQPRLDWQMWFAALSSCAQNEFVVRLQWHVLRRTPAVLALLGDDPFSGEAPARVVRTLRYDYRFAPWQTRGTWWARSYDGPYCPAVQLNAQGLLERAP